MSISTVLRKCILLITLFFVPCMVQAQDLNFTETESTPEARTGKYLSFAVTTDDGMTAGSSVKSDLVRPAHPFAGGSGTEADPYQIATAEQLDSVRHHLDSHFLQTADINLDIAPYNQDDGWEPIGTFEDFFVGSYDGGGHAIYGLFIQYRNRAGLFYELRGDVQNLKLMNVDVTTVYGGAVAFEAINASLSNIEVSGNISGGSSGAYVGGLVGQYSNSSAQSISDIKATITVENGRWSGGIAGSISGDVTINNVVSSQAVSGLAVSGGLIGAITNFPGSITNSYATGEILGPISGGLIGAKSVGPLEIENSYSTATVIGQTTSGGLIGYIQNNNTDEPIQIHYSYTSGEIDADLTGGLIGLIEGTASTIDLSNSFWDTDSLGQIPSVGDGIVNGTDGTGLPITKMKRPDTYADAGWDLDTVWEIKDPYAGEISYPRLRSIPEEPFPGLRDESVPVASNLTVDEEPEYKAILRAEYSFTDGDDDPDRSIIQWYRSDDAGGTNKQAIAGADSTVYYLTKDDIHQYISVEVLPSDGYAEDDKMTFMVGEAQSPFDGGRGTEADPYQVATAGQLDYMRDFLDVYFLQTADIDLDVAPYNQGEGWEPIARANGEEFSGNFDGNGFTISNLMVNQPDSSYVGFFGKSEGVLSSVELQNVNITGKEDVGALVGNNFSGATIKNSHSAGTIAAERRAGGLVGKNEGTIEQSNSSVTAEGQYNIGGLVGMNDQTASVAASFATGDVTGIENSNNIGGLAGINQASRIEDSYATGAVSGDAIVGGFVGNHTGSGAVIENSYSYGAVSTSGTSVGGFVGNLDGIIARSFWDKTTAGDHTPKGVPRKNTFEMKTKSTFTDQNWDFDTVWQMEDPLEGSISYPYLQNNTQAPAPGYRDESAPVAEDVAITGSPDPGSTLEVTYTYTDADGDAETGTEIQWYRSNDETDENKTPITDATSETYTITDEDVCKFISVEVTPGDGYISGETVTASVGQGNAPFAGGCGTVKNPFQIATADHLNNVRDYLGSHFIQTADIDMDVAPYNQGEGWEPILGECTMEDDFTGECMEYEYFSGSYNGNNHTIQNLFIDRPDGYPVGPDAVGVGLFARTDGATIEHLTITNADVTGRSDTGILSGYIYDGEFSIISVSGTVQGHQRVAGISGIITRSSISQAYANVDVTSTENYAGGITGNASESIIQNSYVTGTVTSSNKNYVGGFIGSYNSFGDVQDNQIKNNYAAVEVKNDGSFDGGFSGHLSETNGDLDASGNFWDTDVAGKTSSAFGQGRSLFNMKTKVTYMNAGWDFDAVWQIDEPQNGSISYPYLRNNTQDPAPGYRIENLPVAEDVKVNGEPDYKATLEASYTYTDADDDPEAGTVVQWYRSDDENGTNKQAIHGGGSLTYDLTKADVHKYISFEVTPDDGIARGETVSIMVGEAQSPFDGGRGTEANPYQIATAEQLDYVRDFLDKHFIQTADIDLDEPPYNQGEGWEPIDQLTGVYDGNNHTIDNLYINRPSAKSIGLFGRTRGAELSNLSLTNVDVVGEKFVGALFGDDASAPSTITNIQVTGKVSGVLRVGGITGEGYGSTNISNSYSSAEVNGDEMVGGLVGNNTRTSVIRDSYSTGSVNGQREIGGLVGRNDDDSEIINSYSSGEVTGNDNIGGFVGVNENGGTITGSFWDVETSGIGDPGNDNFGAKGQSLFNMKTKATYMNAGWDFDAVWQIDEPQNGSISYPYLRSITQDPAPGYRIENLPVAEDVKVNGEPDYKATLEASYTYTDADDDPEAGTVVQWYRSDDENGTNKQAIHGGGSLTYHLTKADVHKYISFEVTPDDGIARGETVSIMVGEAQSPFDGGRGTEANPYQIATAEQLDYVRDFLDKHFIQTADIDLDVAPYNQNGWSPLGNFSGVYDGDNFTISNLFINSADFHVGLFSSVKNEVKNLTLQNIDVSGSGSYIGGLTGALLGDLKNIRVSGKVTALHNNVGAIAGLFTEGTASNVHSSVNLVGTSNTGGFFGMVELEDKIEIMGSSFTGTITSDFSAGGFIGRNRKSDNAPAGNDGIPQITNSYYAGTIDADWAGGFIGIDDEAVRITSSYVVGAISSENQHAGGIAGFGGNKTYDSLEDIYVAAKITGNTTGAVFGEVKNPVTVTNVFWDSEATTQTKAAGLGTLNGAIELGRFDMRTSGSFTGFDFNNVWSIDEPKSGYISYPHLVTNEADSIYGRIKVDPPTVSNTYDQQYLSATQAVYQTEVTDDGNYPPVSERGFTWSLAEDFSGDTVMVQHEDDGLGVYNDTLKNLPPYTTIYLKSYAINPVDTTFGDPTSFTTEKQPLKITGHFSVADKVYNGNTKAAFDRNNLKLDSVYVDHDVSLTDIRLNFADKNVAENIEVALTSAELSGADTKKYTLSLDDLHPVTADITPRPITVSADTQAIVYGSHNPDLSYKITSGSLVEGETLSGELARTGLTDVGSYLITRGTLSASSNYELTYESAPFTILPRTLTIAADTGLTKHFGETDPHLTYTATGFAYFENETLLSGSLEREPGDKVGTYAIKQGNISAGNNYLINYKGADFTITGKELIVKVDENLSKVYGEEDPELTYSVSGFETGDNEHLISGNLAREIGEDAGSYAITIGDLQAGDNYSVALHADSMVITPKTLTVRADNLQKVYGEEDPELSYTASGFVRADDASVLGGSLARQEGEDVGTYTVSQGDLQAGINYNIRFERAELQVSPATLVVEAEAGQTKLQGEEDPEFGYNVSGFVWDDDASIITGSLSREEGETPESYALKVGSLEAPNYEIDFSSADFRILRTPPVAEQLQPADGSGIVPVDTSLFVRFNQPIELGSSSNVHLRTAEGEEPELRMKVNEDTLIIIPNEPLAHFTQYEIAIEEGSVQNQDGIPNESVHSKFVTEMATPVMLFPGPEAVEISTAPKLEWNTEAENIHTHIQFGHTVDLTNPTLDTLTMSSEYQLNNLQANAVYYWRVRSVDTLKGISTQSSWSETRQFVTRPNPVEEEDEPVTVTVDFGGTSGTSGGNNGGSGDAGEIKKTDPDQADYRMVGLPGTDGIRLDEFFEGTYQKEWRAFIETGSEQEFYDEYTEDDERFTFRPGLGFWVLSTEIITSDMEFTAVETNADDSYGFPVHPGWNIIANPFQSAVEWSVVEAFNNMESPLYGYNKQFIEADTLQPYQGYYYYNDPALGHDTLFVPYTGFEQRTIDTPAPKDMTPLKHASTIALEGVFPDSSVNKVEMMFGSKNKLATFRQPYPGLDFARFGAVLADSEEEKSRLRYQRTLSTAQPEDEQYVMEVKAPVGSNITWQLDTKNVSEYTGAMLVNTATNQSVIIQGDDKKQIKQTEPTGTYDVYTGDIAYLKEVQESLLPQKFELSQNYPNPFNPLTNIRYALPERVEVRLEIYDILGRKVHTLVNQRQHAGWHVVQWNANGLASGMYLYRLVAGDHVSVKKLTLIK